MMIDYRVNVEANLVSMLNLPQDFPCHRFVGFPLRRLHLRVNPESHRLSWLSAILRDQAQRSPRSNPAKSRATSCPQSVCNLLSLGLHRLEVELNRELNLPGVIDRPRRTIQRVRRTFQETRRSNGTAECRRIEWAEVRRTVDPLEEAYVQRVRQVEGLSENFEAALLLEGKGAAQTQIDRTKIVSDESVSSLNAHAIVVPEDVAVGVEADKLAESLRGLNRGYEPDLEVPCERIPRLWGGHGAI